MIKYTQLILLFLLIFAQSCGSSGSIADLPNEINKPSILAATGGDQQIELSWNSIDEATYYNVYRGTLADESDRATIDSTTSASYTNTGLADNTLYYYWIKACNSVGCSTFSSPISARTTLGIPTDLSADGGNQKIALSWSSVTGATSYDPYRGTSSDGSNRSALGISTTHDSFVDTGVNGQTYYYWLKACNSVGCSAFSNDASATPSTTFSYTLNDTGITWGGIYSGSAHGNNADCTDPTNINADQDCHQGRDASTSLVKIGGDAGFDFTKLDVSGTALGTQDSTWDDSGSEANGTKWSCVKDNHTGLIWEVKNNESRANSIHSIEHRYKWGGITAIGKGHPQAEGDYHYSSNSNSSWDDLVNGSNTEQLCGFDDWRVPTRNELDSIVHRGKHTPAIDDHYFPHKNGRLNSFWSSSPYASDSDRAWSLDFGYGRGSFSYRTSLIPVRLVRFGQ